MEYFLYGIVFIGLVCVYDDGDVCSWLINIHSKVMRETREVDIVNISQERDSKSYFQREVVFLLK